ncbi:serine hydrolase domain-containing protein [Portibacter lacus]|uniref:Beta-lactamase-related domain-containing protein n=1 Tax=Portibacter lacus TaxID=1099794 RepID=A0AA37SPP3_9BACT|nr:serine hydrolase [Portibacter lacus]GLR17227.1 hypothetical protein GCM10007940_18420 [Portibacter lacus]
MQTFEEKKMGLRILFVISVFAYLYSCASKKLVLSEGEILNEMHKNHIGEITFMTTPIPFENYSDEDIKSRIPFGESHELNARMFLSKTLTAYLNELEPGQSVEKLAKSGNFQIAFYVNNNLIYTENLNVNAGSPWYKNSGTVYRIPFKIKESMDHWAPYMWQRFAFQNGGQDLLNSGEHKLKLEVRPYIEIDKIKVGDVIAQGEVTLYSDEMEIDVDENLIQIQAIEDGSGWPLSTDKYNEEKIEALNKRIASKIFKDITSIVVIKDGKLLLEEYFNDTYRNTKHNTRSVGKSFMSAIMGIAIDEGHIKNEDQKLGDFYDLKKFKNYSSDKDDVTIKDLLTMSSGFEGDDGNLDSPGNEEYMYPTKNWVKFALDQPMVEQRTWKYFTAGSVVLGDIIHQSVPGGLEKYAEVNFFEPLGIQDYQWQYTPQKVANTAGGIQMNALDFAKLGQLYKQEGNWNGQQIISKAWVEKSISKQVKIPRNEDDYYGYQFWNKTFFIDGKSYEASYCTGTGGNKIYIFKDIPFVIVITSKAYRLPQAHSQVRKMMEDYILPAVIHD